MKPEMSPKERAVAALTLQIPDKVPTFELEFQISQEMFGIDINPSDLSPENINKLSAAEKDKRMNQLAEDIVTVYEKLDYSIIPGPYCLGYWWNGELNPQLRWMFKKLSDLIKGKRMLSFHADGTFAIPDGDDMYAFSYRVADDPDGVKEEAARWANDAIERNKVLLDLGVEVGLMCSDYCYNTGPFLSPAMFEEIIQPGLARIIDSGRKNGMYMIKHCDGNIMPILNQLVDCNPHALHSIDPMAGVDIKEVKRLVGHKVALAGNVHCAHMQTGTEEEVIASAEYCLTHGKLGGGYIFCTSNVPFKGMPVERYQLILDIWKRMRDY